MVLWMRTAAASMSGHLRAGLDRALAVGPVAVATMAFFAVGREGVETALLLVGYAENAAGSSWPLVGLLLGIAVAAALTVLLYVGAVRIDFARFFRYNRRVPRRRRGRHPCVRRPRTADRRVAARRIDARVRHLVRVRHVQRYGTVLQGIFNFSAPIRPSSR